MTTRVCHSKTIVHPLQDRGPAPEGGPAPKSPSFRRDRSALVMIPANARPAHRRLRARLAEIAAWSEGSDLGQEIQGGRSLGIIASGVGLPHAREAAPGASFLKLGMTYPLPMERIRKFALGVDRCLVIEEGDPYLVDSLRAAGIAVEGKPEMFRFGELDVARVRRIIAGDTTPEAPAPRGKPPQLCQGCPHRGVFQILHDMDCIVAGDIGCYTLGVLPPFEAMDTCVCMGAGITVGLGLRHVLPPEEARRVVSVIGDSTFVHSGLPGLVEMVYNPPPTGHLVLILDNGTTAMTGLQEHPGTGRALGHEPASKLDFEGLIRSLGIPDVRITDPVKDPGGLERQIREALDRGGLSVIITRRPCILAAPKIREYEQAQAAADACGCGSAGGEC